MNHFRTLLTSAFIILLAIVAGFFIWVYATTYHPDKTVQASLSCPATVPAMPANSTFKILSYNVQFFAGKNYVFYFDLKNNAGPDVRPASKDINTTLDLIAAQLIEQDADFVFLQEVHHGAAATDQENQLQQLLARLPNHLYPCISQAYYWKADYIPHPKIMGSVGMKLTTLSKYKIKRSVRHRLPQPPMDWVSAQFYLKRAILESEIATDTKPLILFNTHFDAFAQGSDTMAQQVEIAQTLLKRKDQQGVPWIFGGDLNLLMPGMKHRVHNHQQYLYADQSEIAPLLQWRSIPSQQNIQNHPAQWATHLANDPEITLPDRTIDYLFYSQQLRPIKSQVLNQGIMRTLSDHFPVVSEFHLSAETHQP